MLSLHVLRNRYRPDDAGVIQQHVDGAVDILPTERLDRRVVPDVQTLDAQPREFCLDMSEVIRVFGRPAARDHIPFVPRILTREFQAEAAIGAGDQNRRHFLLRLLEDRSRTPAHEYRRDQDQRVDDSHLDERPAGHPEVEQPAADGRREQNAGRAA